MSSEQEVQTHSELLTFTLPLCFQASETQGVLWEVTLCTISD